jgi:hypothetical protein
MRRALLAAKPVGMTDGHDRQVSLCLAMVPDPNSMWTWGQYAEYDIDLSHSQPTASSNLKHDTYGRPRVGKIRTPR